MCKETKKNAMVSQKCFIFAKPTKDIVLMANTYTQLYTHVVFHTKSTGIVLREEDFLRDFAALQHITGYD